MNLELSKQQIEAKKHLENWRVGALFMQAGTGKTRVACEIVNSIKDVDFVLYVAPLGVIRKRDGIDNVEAEVNKWGGFKVPVMYIGIETIQSSDMKYLDVRNKLLTGHKTEEAFFRYIRISKKENATVLSEHPFFTE